MDEQPNLQPNFEPKDIGEGGEKGYPPVLGAPEEDAQETPSSVGGEPLPDGITPAVDPETAENEVLAGSEIEIKPAGSVETPDLQPRDIGYSEDTGSDAVITRE